MAPNRPTDNQETQTATTNSLGLFTVQIGAGTVVSGTIANVGWGSGANFLKVEIDPAGGTNYTVTGTSQLLSVLMLYMRPMAAAPRAEV